MGWAYVDFTATCFPASDNGLKIQKKVYGSTGLYPIVDQGEQLIGGYTNDERLLYRGCLPVIVFGDHTRRFKYIDRPFVIGADGVKLIKPSAVWHPRCLWYCLQTQKIENRGYSRHYQLLRQIKLWLPPLNEQKRIVEKIEETLSNLDTAIASLERIKANLKRYRASVLQAAVKGRLTAGWRKQNPPSETGEELLARLLNERRAKWEENQLKKYAEQGKTPPRNWKEKYPEPVKPDTTGLPELPEGWVWGTMEELSSGDPYSLAIGPFGSNLKVTDYTEEGVPLVFVRNIRSNEFFGKKCVYVSREKARDLFPHQVSPGDILVTKMGDPPGDVCLYPELSQDAIITADCIKLRLNAILTDKTYFTNAIEANTARKQIFRVTKGVAQQKITLAAFGRVCLPLPPMLEQRQIVDEVNARLNIVDATNEVIDNALQRANQLRQSILKRAFEGRLVAQDPNDEPASVLLERVRAERAAQAATVKPARTQRKAKGHAG